MTGAWTRRGFRVGGLGILVILFQCGCTAPDGPGPGNDNDAECTVDGDCGSGEVCSAAGICVADSGNDNTNTNTNDNSNINDNSNSNENDNTTNPECTIDADCSTGEVCQAGMCVTDAGPECILASDCPPDQVCSILGACVPAGGETPCASDAECASDEVCADDGFCTLDDGSTNPGGSGGGGGSAPQCSTDLDCAADQVCSDGGLCVPDDGDNNFAQVMAGCWELTFTAEGFDPAVAIYQFDADGRLERTWGVVNGGAQIIEELRYTAANALFWDALYTLVEQDVAVNADQASVVISAGLVKYDYVDGPACTIDRTVSCTEISQIQGTLTGSPPDALVDGVLSGDQICETVGNPNPSLGILGAAVTGLRVDCPDAIADAVVSQEEQGDLCQG